MESSRSLKTPSLVLVLSVLVFSLAQPVLADSCETKILNLRTNNAVEPLAVEDENPVFSWQMSSSKIGQRQEAYQIVVARESDGHVVWYSGKVSSGLSNGISYDGEALEPETAYRWELTVWDADGQAHTEVSRFETGIMNPSIDGWEGAQFIGTNQLTLDAMSACLFEIQAKFQILEGNSASIILGADDFRFSDSFLNIENVEGENYIRIEIDLSGVGTERGPELKIYRVGYGKGDSPTVPYVAVNREKYPDHNLDEIFTEANKNDVHSLSIYVETGNITVTIDGTTVKYSDEVDRRGRPLGTTFTISNYPTGNNYNTYPNLCSVGFAANPGDKVVFTDYVIKNAGQSSASNNTVFGPTVGATYSIFEPLPGITVTDDMKIVVSQSAASKDDLVAYTDPSHGSLTMLRTTFRTDPRKTVAKAKMYATAMGSYEMFINGERMGEYWFAPGDTQFRETLGYHAYDVTDMISNGANTIGAILNPAWYTGYMTFRPTNFNFFGDTEALLAKLVITYTDGSRDVVVTDPDTWTLYKNGPIEYGSFFQGERYNANKEANISVGNNVRGWAANAYDDSDWTKPEIIEKRDWIDFDIVARYDKPVTVVETVQAVKVMEIHSEDLHTYTYDMGVDMVGVPSITIPAGWLKAGDTVILRYGEQVYPGLEGDRQVYIDKYGYTGTGKGIAGRILTETYRAALATDFYTAKNSQEVTIQPTTTYRGYQYIQITIPNHEGPLPLENVKGLVLSSDALPTGTYEATTADGTTGRLVNQLVKNIQRSQLGNFFTIPTDCPQRNERMGWTGDAQAYSRTATYNSDAQNFFRQWMVALRDDQGVGSKNEDGTWKEAPGGIGSTVPDYTQAKATSFADGTTWAAAVCMVPWQMYIQYGDLQIVRENFETMKLWLDGMDFYDWTVGGKTYTGLSAKTGGLADWLSLSSTPSELVNNAIYIYMMEVTAIMADAIGETEYAETLRARRAHAKAEWNDAFVDPETGKTRNPSDGSIVHSQTSYATPLKFNVFSDENLERANAYLAELAANPSLSGAGDRTYPAYSITTGFSGTPNILPALSRAGNVEEAFRMISCTDYASWLYPVTMGATTTWERWNSYEQAFEAGSSSMNSFNHFALGAVGEWMYEFQLGITTDHLNGEAGYKHFVLQPTAGGNFTSLRGSYNSNYGVISSGWTADGLGNMTSYSCVVPANTTATLYLPVSEASESFGETYGASFVGKTTRNNITVARYELSSGSFAFVITEGGVTAYSR